MVARKAPPDEVVAQRCNEGLSTAALAAEYSIHRTRVVRILNRAGVDMRSRVRPPKADDEMVPEIAAPQIGNKQRAKRPAEPGWLAEAEPITEAVTAPKPPKQSRKKTIKDFHPVEIHKKSLPLQGPALRLPEEQQRKVARLLAIYQMYWEAQYTALVMRREVTL